MGNNKEKDKNNHHLIQDESDGGIMERSNKKRIPNTAILVVALVAVFGGSVLFAGALAGWFNDVVVLSMEYYDDTPEYIDLSSDEYEELVAMKKSFMIFVDQTGCHTAERLRNNLATYMDERGLNVYHMMFSDLKETSLYNDVRYYPSVVIVSQGKPVAWLRADADEDAEAYNNYDALVEWLESELGK